MNRTFTPGVIASLAICAVLVLALAIMIPVTQAPQNVETSRAASEVDGVNTAGGQEVSDLFKVSGTPKPLSARTIPTDIPKKDACVLNGEVVREGTVASNTICVNETMTPTVGPAR